MSKKHKAWQLAILTTTMKNFSYLHKDTLGASMLKLTLKLCSVSFLGSWTGADLHTDTQGTSENWDRWDWYQFTVTSLGTLSAALAVDAWPSYDHINKLSGTNSSTAARYTRALVLSSRSHTVRCLDRSVHLVGFYLLSLSIFFEHADNAIA